MRGDVDDLARFDQISALSSLTGLEVLP